MRKQVPISAVVTVGVLRRMDVLLLALMAMGATDMSVLAALATKALAELELELELEMVAL